MFKELSPILRQRAVLLTVTHLDEDQIRVNIIPQKIKDGENSALATPLSVSGTAEELDRDLPATLVGFVSSHLQMKNTLEKAQAEMDAAAKAAKAEASAKKTPGKKETAKPEASGISAAAKSAEPVKPEPAKTASLFDVPEVPASPSFDVATNTEAEILAEIRADAAEENEVLAEAA